MGKQVIWTEKQRALIEAIIQAQKDEHKNPLKHAADVCRINYNNARNVLYKMRNRYEAMKYSLEQYAEWRRKLSGRRYL